MKATIGLIAPNKRISDNAYRALKDEILNKRLIVSLLNEDNIVQQAESLIKKGADLIIARGGTYYDLIGSKISVPVVQLNYNTEDILHSINHARKLGDKVILILTSNIVFEIERWKDILNADLELIKFEHRHEIDEVIFNIFEKYKDPVILGGTFTCSRADKLGMKYVEIDNSEATIAATYLRAQEIMDLIFRDNKHLQLLSTVLDNVNEGILFINQEGIVEHYNNNILKFFPDVTKQFIDKKLSEVIPELKFVIESLNGKKIENHILKKGKFILNVNTVTVNIEGDKLGVVCTIQDLTEIQKLEEDLRYKLNPKGLSSKYTFENIFTKNKKMKEVIENTKEFARADSTILIYGESGTGKEMFAQSIHNYSERKNAPFVAVNCGALSESLLESELFGYVEGAFTGARKGGKQGLFELAHKGTIFLDEINSLPLEIQSKFLRIIEEKEVMRLGSDYVIPLDVRIIVASNEKLINMVEKGEFRRDLFYRLNVLEIKIPTLKERQDDIMPLFEIFLKEFNSYELPVSEELAVKLKEYQWKGNIRELRNVAERYALLKDKMNFEFLNESNDEINFLTDDLKIDLKELNKTVEELVIESLINKGISKNEISNILGISRTALWKKINNN
ncbi:sigma 54-interacting transcriptional regulator [Sedimentibacter sp.]|uniref:sigma 54-interacting transcriptional regulator n=1 Tax=Sedimentibacter sp. TaxID=1960295 RepID=UPI0028AD22A5|nr:sigma 54-interacting transcriptional regulator [Sedimentibacter sp.]